MLQTAENGAGRAFLHPEDVQWYFKRVKKARNNCKRDWYSIYQPLLYFHKLYYMCNNHLNIQNNYCSCAFIGRLLKIKKAHLSCFGKITEGTYLTKHLNC